MSDLPGLKRRLDRFMGERGLKHTRQRDVILQALTETDGHLSLDELLARVQQELPGVGYATVYRAMKLFTAAGVALERRFGDGQTRYEPAAVDGEHHDHLICVVCGRIVEFEDEVIEARQAEVACAFGMSIVRHRLDIWGRCLDEGACQLAAQENKAAGTPRPC